MSLLKTMRKMTGRKVKKFSSSMTMMPVPLMIVAEEEAMFDAEACYYLLPAWP